MEILPQKNVKEEVEALRLVSLAGDKQKEVDALNLDISRLADKLETINTTLAHKQATLASVEEMLSSIPQKEKKLVKLEASLQALTASITETKTETEKASLILADRRSELAEVEDFIRSAQQRITDETEASRSELEAKVAGLKSEASTKKGEVTRLTKRITELESTTAEHEAEITELLKRKEDLGLAVVTEEANLSAIKEAIISLAGKEAEITRAESEARAKLVQDSQAELDKLKEAKAQKAVEIATLSQELEELETKKQEAISFVDIKISEVQAIKRSALIEIGKVVEGNRLEKLPEGIQEAINSITNL